MFKLLFTFLFIIGCIALDDSQPRKDKVIVNPPKQKPKCEYEYFINESGNLDSSIVSCPEVLPPESPND